MGLLTGLFTGVKTLLGFSGASKGADNVMKVASGIGNWIDEQKLTDEERLNFRSKMIEHYGVFMQSTVGENTQRSITRREIAVWVIRLEAVFLIMYGILGSFELKAAAVWKYIAVDSPWGLLTLGVGAFFFGTHLVRAATKQ